MSEPEFGGTVRDGVWYSTHVTNFHRRPHVERSAILRSALIPAYLLQLFHSQRWARLRLPPSNRLCPAHRLLAVQWTTPRLQNSIRQNLLLPPLHVRWTTPHYQNAHSPRLLSPAVPLTMPPSQNLHRPAPRSAPYSQTRSTRAIISRLSRRSALLRRRSTSPQIVPRLRYPAMPLETGNTRLLSSSTTR